jgi:hypothetical protein
LLYCWEREHPVRRFWQPLRFALARSVRTGRPRSQQIQPSAFHQKKPHEKLWR